MFEKKENNDSIDKRFNGSNKVRNEEISVKINNNIINKIIFMKVKANPVNEGHNEIEISY